MDIVKRGSLIVIRAVIPAEVGIQLRDTKLFDVSCWSFR